MSHCSSGTTDLNFATMQIVQKSLGEFTRKVRRLGPTTRSEDLKRFYNTIWLWYWQDDDGRYVEYGQKVRMYVVEMSATLVCVH